jgi:elongation factor P hydroxylase
MNSTHKYEQLIEIFDGCFADDFNTRLIKGDDEPIYLPADDDVPYNRIVFAHGFYASGLHEISHWCIAGKARRELVDFGYWYCPDGRDAMTQSQFEDVEVKPQAFDWLFCVAAGFPFNVSCDNLEGDFEPDRIAFSAASCQVMTYLEQGIPERPARLFGATRILSNAALDGRTIPVAGRPALRPRLHTRGKMIAEFESRILALIDDMVDHASDDELFASGYLRGHLTLAVAELEGEGDTAQAVHDKVPEPGKSHQRGRTVAAGPDSGAGNVEQFVSEGDAEIVLPSAKARHSLRRARFLAIISPLSLQQFSHP